MEISQLGGLAMEVSAGFLPELITIQYGHWCIFFKGSMLFLSSFSDYLLSIVMASANSEQLCKANAYAKSVLIEGKLGIFPASLRLWNSSFKFPQINGMLSVCKRSQSCWHHMFVDVQGWRRHRQVQDEGRWKGRSYRVGWGLLSEEKRQEKRWPCRHWFQKAWQDTEQCHWGLLSKCNYPRERLSPPPSLAKPTGWLSQSPPWELSLPLASVEGVDLGSLGHILWLWLTVHTSSHGWMDQGPIQWLQSFSSVEFQISFSSGNLNSDTDAMLDMDAAPILSCKWGHLEMPGCILGCNNKSVRRCHWHLPGRRH